MNAMVGCPETECAVKLKDGSSVVITGRSEHRAICLYRVRDYCNQCEHARFEVSFEIGRYKTLVNCPFVSAVHDAWMRNSMIVIEETRMGNVMRDVRAEFPERVIEGRDVHNALRWGKRSKTVTLNECGQSEFIHCGDCKARAEALNGPIHTDDSRDDRPERNGAKAISSADRRSTSPERATARDPNETSGRGETTKRGGNVTIDPVEGGPSSICARARPVYSAFEMHPKHVP